MKRCRGGKRLRKSAARIAAPKWMVIGLCVALVLSLMLPLAGNAIIPMAFAAEDSTGLCPHHKSHDESCGWQPAKKGSSNAHVHDENYGNAVLEVGTPSNVRDDAYRYTALEVGTPSNVRDDAWGSAEAQEGHPCMFLCEWCVTAWAWNDEESVLVWSDDIGAWGLGMPGASQEQPVTREILEELLPKAVTVQTATGSKTVDVTWDLSVIPEEGVWEKDCTLTAALPGEYVLTDGVPALKVLLALGGGEVYDLKAINVCTFIPRTGTTVYQDSDGMWSIDIRLPAGLSSQELAERVGQILPGQVRGYT